MPIHTKATTKKTPYRCRPGPPNTFPTAMRPNASGTIPRLARRGHLSQGASQNAVPSASAIPQTAATAVAFNPGAGNGMVIRPSTPDPAKNMAARRPDSLRRSMGPSGPSFSDNALMRPSRKKRPEMGPANGFPHKGAVPCVLGPDITQLIAS